MFNTETENYIEHEVRLRTHEEKFKLIDKRFDKVDLDMRVIRNDLSKVLVLMKISGAALSLIAIPILLHYFGA